MNIDYTLVFSVLPSLYYLYLQESLPMDDGKLANPTWKNWGFKVGSAFVSNG
jgi:hypothetical protein